MKITICLVKINYRFCAFASHGYFMGWWQFNFFGMLFSPIVYLEGFLHASICLLLHLFSYIILDLVVCNFLIPGFAQMNLAIEISCRSGMSITDFFIFSTLFLDTHSLFWISNFQFFSNLRYFVVYILILAISGLFQSSCRASQSLCHRLEFILLTQFCEEITVLT